MRKEEMQNGEMKNAEWGMQNEEWRMQNGEGRMRSEE
jgi:hypothetical protein